MLCHESNKMNNSMKNIITLGVIAMALFIVTQIQLLIIYLFISIVISITINPISNKICNMKIGAFKISKTIASIMCLLIIMTTGSIIGYILSPLIIEELQIISSIRIQEVQNFLNIATNQINNKLSVLNLDIKTNLIDVMNIVNISSISGLFQSMLGILGNIFMAICSVLFISFFLIKDKALIKEKTTLFLSYFIPNANKKINTIIYFIRRYFIGLCIQTSILFILFGFSMMILGLPNPWTLAVFAAVINIIPYFGPLIGFVFTSTIVGTIYIDQNMIDLILPLILKLLFLFGIIQSIDNFIIQPTIYSKAFNAHPLEIFFVAMSAGFIGGVMWMIIAMPIYTIIRIIFSELLTNLQKA